MIKLYRRNSSPLQEVDDNSIGLVVTSPPYFDAIDYDAHIDGQRYTENFTNSIDAYQQEMQIHLQSWMRTLIPGRFACVVIGSVISNKKYIDLPSLFSCWMTSVGFEFAQEIIWDKVTGGVKRAGVYIQHPYPLYYYSNIMHERILIFKKPGEVERKKENGLPVDDMFTKEIANSVWHIAPVPPNQLDHPCPFPEEIPRRIISLYSYIGDTVLDPFNGIGTTTKVAHALKRNAIGYEIRKEYHRIAQQRSIEKLCERKQIHVKYDHFPVDKA